MRNLGHAQHDASSNERPLRMWRALLTLVCLLSVCAGFTAFSVRKADAAGSLATQDEKGAAVELSASAMAQIQALMAEKESRTVGQRKMDSQLVYASKMASGAAIANGVSRLEVDVKVIDGLTPVEIRTRQISQVERLVKKLGGVPIREFEFAGTVEARMPLDKIEALAADDAVMFVASPSEAILNRAEAPAEAAGPAGPPSARFNRPSFAERQKLVRAKLTEAMAKMGGQDATTNIGSRNSQGDVTHRANNARGTFGINGAGIRIGVLSDSFNNLGAAGADVTLGDLPGPGNPNGFTTPVRLAGSGDQPAGGSDEGRAMLQIIHDVAPGAQLFYATAFNSITDFANNIRALRGIATNPGPSGNVTPGCNIIIDDIFYFVETGLHDGQLAPSDRNMAVVTQAVNDVTANGALYFSSAGNSGNLTQNTSGAFEGDFVSGTRPAIIPGTGDALAWNGTDVGNTILANGGGPTTMQWSDPIGGSGNDYDLFRLNSTLTTVIASSTNVQTGTQDPFEQITTGANTRLVVVRRTGAAARFISLSTNRGRLQFATNGQTRGHACAVNGFGVAATPAAGAIGPAPNPTGPFPNPFNATNVTELFSSDGPRRSFFNADGTAITPGNFLVGTNGGIVRQKPDITAADGVDTTLPAGSGLNPFFGTSAAAPHAGAIAALVKQAAPMATPTQLRNFLTSTALDIMAPGVDEVSGVGIVQAFQAVQATGATPMANLGLGPVTVNSMDARIDPNECNTLTVGLTNNGAVNATAISATLSTTTPGVTVTQATSSYPTIAPMMSATNAAPFQVSTTAAAMCGTTINFTLTVNFTGGTSPATFMFTLPLGQDVNNYQFTSTPMGATIPAGGTLVPGSAADDAVVTAPTPFAFSVYGTPVTAGQTITLSTNGNIQFVASGASDDFVNIGLPVGTAAIPAFPANAPAIFPYWDDLILTTPGGGIFTNTVGTAPNRQFIVEWRGARFLDPLTTQTLNFAVVFNEGSNQFQFRYVQTGVGTGLNGASATVGVQAGGAAGSNFTQFSLNQGVITPGLQLAAALGQCTPGPGPCNANVNINSLVTLAVTNAVSQPTSCMGNADEVLVTATLTNRSAFNVTGGISFQLTQLQPTSGAAPVNPYRLLSADGATCTSGGVVGAIQTGPMTLAPGASAPVTFRVLRSDARRLRIGLNVLAPAPMGFTPSSQATPLTIGQRTFKFDVQGDKPTTQAQANGVVNAASIRTFTVR